MPIFNPIAIQKDGHIFLRYFEQPEPSLTDSELCENDKQYFRERLEHHNWRSSFKEVPFKDQEAIRMVIFDNKNIGYPVAFKPLDSIADRIDIVDGLAIIKPEEEQESQKQLLQALMEMDRFGIDRILQHFEIRRKK